MGKRQPPTSPGVAGGRKQTRIDPDATERPAFVLAERYAAGAVPWHTHRRAQLLYVSAGVLTVRTEHGAWAIPPLRGVWVPPGVRHSVGSRRPYSLCTLYVQADMVSLPKRCAAVEIEPLVRELLLAASRFGADYTPESAEDRLIHVILDRIPRHPSAALHIPECRDPRLRPITEALAADPADPRSLAEWSRAIGMSERNLARAFVEDLRMTFGAWRRQLRLLAALQGLCEGESVTQVAMKVGYSDVSAFIATFKSALGETPGHYHHGQAPAHEKVPAHRRKHRRST